MTSEFYDWLLMMPNAPHSPEVVMAYRGHHIRFSWCGPERTYFQVNISDIGSTIFDIDEIRGEGQKWIDSEIDFLESQPNSSGS